MRLALAWMQRTARATVAPLFLLAAAALLPACNSMDGPEVISLSSAEYPAYFEACLDQAREAGMPAALADRTIGIIETTPRHIGSIFEPWRQDSTGIVQGAEATIQYERRRVRFEFVPAGFTLPAPSGEARLTGPDVPGSLADDRRFDLEHYEGEVQLRAWVYVERAFTPGLKPGTWSLSLTTTWTDPITNNPYRSSTDTTTRSPTTWTPISRDEAMERTLLANVQKQLEQGALAARAGAAAAPTSDAVVEAPAAPSTGAAEGTGADTPAGLGARESPEARQTPEAQAPTPAPPAPPTPAPPAR